MSGIKVRLKQIEDSTAVRLLVTHPMETGRRIEGVAGKAVPAHYIDHLTVVHQDKVVVSCELGPGVSKDPYFSFHFRNGKPGDLVTVVWTDNLGNSEKVSETIK